MQYRMRGSVGCSGLVLSGIYQCWENWYTAKGKIRQHFQGFLCPSFVRQVCFLHDSTEFRDMQKELQRKIILAHFLLYYFSKHSPITCVKNRLLANYSLPNTLLPNCLLQNNHSQIAPFPRSIAPQSLARKHPLDTWFYTVHVAPWLLDSSHQPRFGQDPP